MASDPKKDSVEIRLATVSKGLASAADELKQLVAQMQSVLNSNPRDESAKSTESVSEGS